MSGSVWGTLGSGMAAATSGRPSVTPYKNFSAAACIFRRSGPEPFFSSDTRKSFTSSSPISAGDLLKCLTKLQAQPT
jgi:hypothetical protein